jgi:hypothetical protein
MDHPVCTLPIRPVAALIHDPTLDTDSDVVEGLAARCETQGDRIVRSSSAAAGDLIGRYRTNLSHGSPRLGRREDERSVHIGLRLERQCRYRRDRDRFSACSFPTFG